MTTLVLIPGLLSDQRVWTEVARAAPAGFTVRHADLTLDATIPAMAERALASATGEVIAVGHSLGGRVAMEMARQAPTRVRGLVLANTGHHPRQAGEEVKRQQMIDLGHRSMAELAAVWLPPMLHPARTSDAALIADLTAMVLQAGAGAHERQIRALLARPDAAAYLPRILCPILLIAARQDGWSPVAQHEAIAALAPDAELTVIEDAGHFAPVERPAAVAGAIADWLSRRFGAMNA